MKAVYIMQSIQSKTVIDYIHNHKPSKDVIVVGQSPAKTNNPSASGTYAVINAWLTSACVYSWSFTNVIDEEGGDRLSQVDFEAVYKRVRPWKGKKVIALGNLASEVLTELRIPHLKLLHPSGLNRHLNKFDNRIEQIRLIHEYVKGSK
jgi:hypothetical protein